MEIITSEKEWTPPNLNLKLRGGHLYKNSDYEHQSLYFCGTEGAGLRLYNLRDGNVWSTVEGSTYPITKWTDVTHRYHLQGK